VSHWIAGATPPVALAHALLRQICAALYARPLRIVLNCPPEPTTQRYQRRPIREPEQNLASLLIYGGVGIGLVWFLDDADATHNANP
jgi:hypothetical protein